MAWVLNNSPTSGNDKIVLLGIANHADADGNNAYPSVARLARYANLSERGVQKILHRLADEGHVMIHAQAGGSASTRADRRPNLYSIVMHGVNPGSSRDDERGELPDTDGVNSGASRGEPACSPEPSLEPSIEPSVVEISSDETEAARLCTLLADRIEANGYKRPTVTRDWIRAMDRMIRIDGREPWQIERAIEWALADDFWSMNIRSPHKLREHYDRLRAQATRQQRASAPRGFSAIAEFLNDHERNAL